MLTKTAIMNRTPCVDELKEVEVMHTMIYIYKVKVIIGIRHIQVNENSLIQVLEHVQYSFNMIILQLLVICTNNISITCSICRKVNSPELSKT